MTDTKIFSGSLNMETTGRVFKAFRKYQIGGGYFSVYEVHEEGNERTIVQVSPAIGKELLDQVSRDLADLGFVEES